MYGFRDKETAGTGVPVPAVISSFAVPNRDVGTGALHALRVNEVAHMIALPGTLVSVVADPIVAINDQADAIRFPFRIRHWHRGAAQLLRDWFDFGIRKHRMCMRILYIVHRLLLHDGAVVRNCAPPPADDRY